MPLPRSRWPTRYWGNAWCQRDTIVCVGVAVMPRTAASSATTRLVSSSSAIFAARRPGDDPVGELVVVHLLGPPVAEAAHRRTQQDVAGAGQVRPLRVEEGA